MAPLSSLVERNQITLSRYWTGKNAFLNELICFIFHIRPTDHEVIREIFPGARFQYIPDAGHWVHSEKPGQFLEVVLKFMHEKDWT